MARSLLYGESTINDPRAANLHPSSKLAHERASAPDSIRGIFPIANKRWKQTNGDRWFGPCYQHILPSQWAHQILHLNITSALSAMIIRCSHNGNTAKKYKSCRNTYTLGQNSHDRGSTTTTLKPKKTRTPTLHTASQRDHI
eukprot:scaffold225477_cov42-Attheya_sp.AAC.1